MTRVQAGAFGDHDEQIKPTESEPSHVFVAYPVQEEVELPSLGKEPPPQFPLWMTSYGPTNGPALYFKTEETSIDGVEPLRDGSLALHITALPEVLIVPRQLAPLVRVFSDPQGALSYAQMQNSLLSALHDLWLVGAEQMKLQAESMVGRIIINAAPQSVLPQMGQSSSSFSPTGLAEDPLPQAYQLDWPGDGVIRFSPQSMIQQFQNYAAHIVDAIDTNSPPHPTFVDRLRALSKATPFNKQA